MSAQAKARLLEALVRAVRTQDKDALLELLAEDAAWTADGGGNAPAARKVIQGAGQVARFATGVYRKIVGDVEFRPVTVNGEPGFAVFNRGRARLCR